MSPFKSKDREYPSDFIYKLNEDPQISLDVETENTANLEIPHPGLEIHIRGLERREGIEVPRIPLKGKEGMEVVIYDHSAQEVCRLGWEPGIEEEVEREIERRKEKRYNAVYSWLDRNINNVRSGGKKTVRGGLLGAAEEIRNGIIVFCGRVSMVPVAFVEGLFREIPLGLKDHLTKRWDKERELIKQALEAEKESSRENEVDF